MKLTYCTHCGRKVIGFVAISCAKCGEKNTQKKENVNHIKGEN